MLIDQLSDEPGQVLSRQPVIQRRRQQQHLIGIEEPERLVHRHLRSCRNALRQLDPVHLEQAVFHVIDWHTP